MIHLNEQEKNTLLKIFSTFMPTAKIYVFGSRITAKCHPYSDLDIALDNKIAISPEILMKLEETLAETSLPFKVDISDFQKLDPAFQKKILDNHILLK